MFRYERPQKGRYRQFYQLGAEVFGIENTGIDLEIIILNHRLWKLLGINSHLTLEINSIGSQKNRVKYKQKLISFLENYRNVLDEESKKRLYINPFRILDSKNQNIQKILKNAPLLSEFIDASSRKNFEDLCKMISSLGIKYRYNQNLVRGLDYYNNTVFEWKSDDESSQNTICAGGRYDFLSEEIGGKKTYAMGFAIGMERLVLMVRSLSTFFKKTEEINIYIIPIEDHNKFYAIKISEEIRNLYPKLKIFINFLNINIKKKIKNAINLSARIIIFIGNNEIKKSYFLVKDLKEKKEYRFSKNELMIYIKKIFLKIKLNKNL